MIRRVNESAREFLKQAETPEEADRLRHEARVLAVARHPGVVQFLAMEGDTLRLRLVDGQRLCDLTGPTPAELAQWATAAATTLADLHDIGVVHRALSAEHLLIEPSGAPILSGFGHAGMGDEVGATDQAEDVAALARILRTGSSDTAIDGHWDRLLARAAQSGSGGPSARQLARALAEASADGPPRGRALIPRVVARSGVIAAIAVVAVVVAVVVVVIRLVLPASPRHDAAPAAPTVQAVPTGAAVCPSVDRGCGPLPHPNGIIDTAQGQYRIGQPSDLIVVGRWQCGAALPALLQPASGDVWVWSSWGAGTAPVSARLVAQVPRARSVRVDPGLSGCDRLWVLLPGDTTVVVQPGGTRRGGAA